MKLLEKIITSFVTLFVLIGLFISFHVWKGLEGGRDATGGHVAIEHNHGNDSVEHRSVIDAAESQYLEALATLCYVQENGEPQVISGLVFDIATASDDVSGAIDLIEQVGGESPAVDEIGSCEGVDLSGIEKIVAQGDDVAASEDESYVPLGDES